MSDNLFKYKNVNWSLPMMFEYEFVYITMYKIFKKYGFKFPQAFLYGSPSCAWTGGRAPTIYSQLSRNNLMKRMQYVTDYNAIPTFTFSYSDITKKDLQDKYANMILDAALEVGARFIVYSDRLRDYIKSKNSNATVIASVIKPAIHFQGPDKKEPTAETEAKYYNELLKEYDIVVVRPEFSKYALTKNPELINDLSRIEVLINQTCFRNCPKMPDHYRYNESRRLAPKTDNRKFDCFMNSMSSINGYKNYTAHTEKQVQKLVKSGVKNLKLQGRSNYFHINSFIMLMASQMFNLDGSNYAICLALAQNSILAEEISIFKNFVLNDNPPPVIRK